MRKIKIISGGQTGADRAGLDAARVLGIKTGGVAPKGFRTMAGLDTSLKDYGLEESRESGYRARTIMNVRGSNGTVWFGDETSPGGKLTLGVAKRSGKPLSVNPTIAEFREWVDKYNIEVLNVAGNAEEHNPGTYMKVKEFLLEAFSEWNFR